MTLTIIPVGAGGEEMKSWGAGTTCDKHSDSAEFSWQFPEGGPCATTLGR